MTKDPAEAVKWYRKAADQREPQAEHALGLCYADGDGVPSDPVEAFKWISLAASHGHPPAVQLKQLMERRKAEARSAIFFDSVMPPHLQGSH